MAFHSMTVSDRPIPRTEESFQVCVCVCHWVWSGATRTFYTYSEPAGICQSKKDSWHFKTDGLFRNVGKCCQFSLCNSPEERSS